MAGAGSAQEAATSTPNPFGQGGPQTSSPAKKKARAAQGLKSGQFATEADAGAACKGDPIVWANTGTKVYHHAGTAAYGHTKRGAYMCEKDAGASGFHASKREKSK